MIVPMKKVSLVLLDKEKTQALKQLRSLGVVHLENVEGKGETLAAFKHTYETLVNAAGFLSEIKVPKKFEYCEVSDQEALNKALRILELQDMKKECFEIISGSTNELERLSGWGEFNPQDFEALIKNGICLSLYEIPTDKTGLIGDDVKTILVNQTKTVTRFLLLSETPLEERPQGLPPEAFNIVLPEKSSAQLMDEIRTAEKKIDDIQQEMNDSVRYLKSIRKYCELIQKDIEFENFQSGMHVDEGADTKLAWLTGYVPADCMDVVVKAAKENAWAFASDDPALDDPVPTKLKNNKLVSLIYPLTDFLGTVPGYHEYDISGWFLFFFTIFFGMIFGDGGYGLLITIGILSVIIAKKLSGKKVHPMFGLVLLVGLATVAWGTVTCTWFGIPADLLRKLGLGFLPDISVPVLSNAYSESSPGVPALWSLPWNKPGTGLTTSQCTQIFCFVIALLQLSIAHLKCAITDRKSLKIFGDIGSLMQLWGMFYVVLMMVISKELFPMDAFLLFSRIPVGQFCIGILAGGFLLSFIFSNYEGSVLKSIAASCKNIISVILGIVNVFSDILSYVRLWAVGLAGSAISGTVNNMAGQILGAAAGPIVVHAIFFLLVIALLVFGHGLNIILNVLSVLVHGVRLNTLEFSSHMGMEWSGIKYEPFK